MQLSTLDAKEKRIKRKTADPKKQITEAHDCNNLYR